MKLFVDIGNTAIKFACDKNGFTFVGRLFNHELNEDKIDNVLSNVSDISEVDIASVVPNVTNKIKDYFAKKGIKVREIKVDDYKALKIEIDHKEELGMDLYCDLVAGLANYGPSTLIVDLGTASKILLIDKNGLFNSCVIVPGIDMSKKMLSKETALLPVSEIKDIKDISKCRNTMDVISSSVYYGHIEMINGLLRRYEDEIGYPCKHVFTGGNAKMIMNNISGEYVLDENLCLKGIAEIVK